MQRVTEQLVSELEGEQKGAVVSMYMPTHRFPSPPHVREDQTRFKNLLREASLQWQARGEEETGQRIHRQLEKLIGDVSFWRGTTEGLALFASSENVTMCRLPIECEEYVHVANAFEITPLYTLLAYDQPYYLLSVAVHDPALFRGDMYGLERVSLELPKSPEDALNIDELFSNSQTVRGREGAGRLAGDIAPHGQGNSNDAGTEERLQFFRMVDDKVARFVKKQGEEFPVLLAGTEEDISDYKALSRLDMYEGWLSGNAGAVRAGDLHAYAWPLIKHETEKQELAALSVEYEKMTGRGQSSVDVDEIEEAARGGRVAKLAAVFIPSTRDSITDGVRMRVSKMSLGGMHERLLRIARHVRNTSGTVVALSSDRLPGGGNAVALFRY